jgi:hypothetical protein
MYTQAYITPMSWVALTPEHNGSNLKTKIQIVSISYTVQKAVIFCVYIELRRLDDKLNTHYY